MEDTFPQTALSVIISYQEAIFLTEFYLSVGWTNSNHVYANEFHKRVIAFAENYEKDWPNEPEIYHQCFECRKESTKTVWALNHRKCPKCLALNRNALMPKGEKL